MTHRTGEWNRRRRGSHDADSHKQVDNVEISLMFKWWSLPNRCIVVASRLHTDGSPHHWLHTNNGGPIPISTSCCPRIIHMFHTHPPANSHPNQNPWLTSPTPGSRRACRMRPKNGMRMTTIMKMRSMREYKNPSASVT